MKKTLLIISVLILVFTSCKKEKTIVSYNLAENYSWERCANETFAFLSEVANQSKYN